MFREFVILLYAGFVCGVTLKPGSQNGPASPSPAADSSPEQDHLAVPSETSYSTVTPPSVSYLPTPSLSYELKPAVVDNIAEKFPGRNVPVQTYGAPGGQQKPVTFTASVASDPSSPEYSNILERYAPSVPPIQPYFAAPVSAKTVTVGSYQGNGQVQAGYAQNVRPVLVYNNVGQNQGYAQAAYAQNVRPIQVYSNAAQNQGQAQVGYGQNARPVLVYNNVAPQRPQNVVPFTVNKATLESYGSVSVLPSPQRNEQVAQAAVAQTIDSGAVRQLQLVPYSINTANVQSQSPAVATYQVNHVQAVSPPQVQYVPQQPRLTYAVNPVVPVPVAPTVAVPVVQIAPKKVAIESYGSVTNHGVPASKYAPAPIPVPVIIQQVEQYQPSAQPVAVLAKAPSATLVQVPVSGQPIPWSGIPAGTAVRYQTIPVSGGQEGGYAKAVVFSPASQVSHVTFNGLGVSYGW